MTAMPMNTNETQPAKSSLVRKLPILVILAVAAAGAFFLRDQISFAALAENREALIAFRDANYLLAVVAFVAGYAAIVGFSLPGARSRLPASRSNSWRLGDVPGAPSPDR